MKILALLSLLVINFTVYAEPAYQGKVKILDQLDLSRKVLIADFSVAADPAPGHEESYFVQEEFAIIARDSESNQFFFCYIGADSPIYTRFLNGMKKLTDGMRVTIHSNQYTQCTSYVADFYSGSLPAPQATNSGNIQPGIVFTKASTMSGQAYSNACNNPLISERSIENQDCLMRFFSEYNEEGLTTHFDFWNTHIEKFLAHGDLSIEAQELINSSNIGIGTVFIYNKVGVSQGGTSIWDFRIKKASFVR